jgi:hypothetical protein
MICTIIPMPLVWYAILAAVTVAPLLALGLAARLARRHPAATRVIVVSVPVRRPDIRRHPIRLLDPAAPGRPRPRAPSGNR